MATGLPYEGDAPATYKRAIALDDDEDLDEGVMRSMARRKKNAPPMDINKKCSHCDRIFKRPCDLTKHEKTHSRPWKCTDTTCKYNQIGWPTEKERDRHMNDKHADSPNTFNCQFEPCPYSSKRESNCKQHMEKAHGWVYIRSKHSSRALGAKSKRGIKSPSVQATPDTPSASTPASGPTDFSTPSMGPTLSPFEASMDDEDEFEFNFADPPPPPPMDPVNLANFFASLPDQPPDVCNPNMVNFANPPDQPHMGNTNFQVIGSPSVPGYSNGYNSIGVAHSADVVSPGINQPTGYDNAAGFALFTGNDNSAGYTNSTDHGNFPGFENSTGVNSPAGYHSARQASSAGMTNDQVFADFDNSLASLQAQFAAADRNSLIPSIVSEPVPDLGESGSMSGTLSLAESPQATADTGNALLDIDWSGLGNLDNMNMSSGMEDLASFQVDGAQCTNVSGLSPGAQGNLMLYSPDFGLSAGNISANFPFGHPAAQQPLGDFTLFGNAQPQGTYAEFD